MGVRGSKMSARGAGPFEPHFVLGAELCFQFLPQALRERRALAVCGNGDLEIAALHDGAVIKMAVFDIIHGVAENSAGLSFSENRIVHAGSGSGRDNKISAEQIAGLEDFWQPFPLTLPNPLGEL